MDATMAVPCVCPRTSSQPELQNMRVMTCMHVFCCDSRLHSLQLPSGAGNHALATRSLPDEKKTCNGATGASQMHRHGFLHALFNTRKESCPSLVSGLHPACGTMSPPGLPARVSRTLRVLGPGFSEPTPLFDTFVIPPGPPACALAVPGGIGEGVEREAGAASGGGSTSYGPAPRSRHHPPLSPFFRPRSPRVSRPKAFFRPPSSAPTLLY